MRVRNNPDAAAYLENNRKLYIIDPKSCKGKWKELFNNNNPIHIEIGMGKGQFIYSLAARNKDINYIGIEKNVTILALALQRHIKMANDRSIENKKQNNNLRYVSIDAEDISDIFSENEVDMIYLNFSDPWHKAKHTKRRLTYEKFLIKYKGILKMEGVLQLKTDNTHLFDFSAVSMNNFNMIFECMSVDLHNSKYANDNVMTEYEEKFSSLGQPIFMIRARFKKEI